MKILTELKPVDFVRFATKIKPVGSCWIWQGAPNKQGYGQFNVNKRCRLAHRVSYILHYGEDIDGSVIMHKCDTPLCVKPSHLVRGTHADNVADKMTKGRHQSQGRTHCPRNHEWTEENTYRPPRKNQKVCRVCRLENQRRWHSRRRAESFAS